MSTSAGRSLVSARSIAMLRSTASAVSPWPVRTIVTSSSKKPLEEGYLTALAVDADLVAAHMYVGLELALDDLRNSSAGAEDSHHRDAVREHDVCRGRGCSVIVPPCYGVAGDPPR